MKLILYIAIVVSLVTYLFWGYLPKGSFYIGNSLFIFLICLYTYLKDSKNILIFILFSLSLNNLFDEILFDNTKFQINELIIGFSILIFSLIKYKNDRKRP